jgi:hypothetical protein
MYQPTFSWLWFWLWLWLVPWLSVFTWWQALLAVMLLPLQLQQPLRLGCCCDWAAAAAAAAAAVPRGVQSNSLDDTGDV